LAGLIGVLLVAMLPGAVRASVLPVQAELSLVIASGASDLAVTASSTPAVVVNGSGGGSHIASLALASGALATTGIVEPVTDPAAHPIKGLQLTAANQTGLFAESVGGELGGTMPLTGALRLCLFGPCGAAIANLVVPLGVAGLGGTITGVGAVNVTVQGGPWTTGTASVGIVIGTPTAMGFAHGPASGTTSTAQPGGEIQLVTPIRVRTSIAGDGQYLALFGILRLTVVPEPGTGVLLACGVAGLVLSGRHAARRRHAAG
jgi:hypothetical protein